MDLSYITKNSSLFLCPRYPIFYLLFWNTVAPPLPHQSPRLLYPPNFERFVSDNFSSSIFSSVISLCLRGQKNCVVLVNFFSFRLICCPSHPPFCPRAKFAKEQKRLGGRKNPHTALQTFCHIEKQEDPWPNAANFYGTHLSPPPILL